MSDGEKGAAETELGAALGGAAIERKALLVELDSATQRSAALEAIVDGFEQAHAELQDIINQVKVSRGLRYLSYILSVLRRLHLASRSEPPISRLVDLSKSGRLLGFDREFYLERYPDVADAGVDPFEHYIEHGRAEGRSPSRPSLERAHQAQSPSSNLRLSDFCEPDFDEAGAKVSDEAFLLSVLTPIYNIEPRYIRELYQTLRNQSYSNWEWVVVDDGSTVTASIAIMREIAELDPRVQFFCSPTNLGISGASNLGLSHARGSYVALVDHDDLLARGAFFAIYNAWLAAPDTQLFFTDEAILQLDGTVTDLWAKPGWSPAYLEYTMCVGHLSVYLRVFLESLRFRSEFDGTQDFDLALRASLLKPLVVHVPVFAYLWRAIAGSAAAGHDQKPHAFMLQRKAVLDYAQKRHPDATVDQDFSLGYWRIRYPLGTPPLLSYVIPAGGGIRTVRDKGAVDLVLNCVRSFHQNAFYPNCEYVIVHNGNLSREQIRAISKIPGARLVVHSDESFNFSRTVNVGVANSRGEYICLLNDDVEAITKRGGEEMVGYLAANPDVAVIGPKCLFESGDIQQSGVVLLQVGPAHAGTGMPRNFSGHRWNLSCRRDVFCIGAAMMVLRKDIFQEVGGFAEDMPLNYNDVDFCLRLRERGRRCVVDPKIEVYHYESATKIGTAVAEQERLYLGREGISDPYFSKWFNPVSPLYEIDVEASRRLMPLGAWLDRHIASRAARADKATDRKLTVCLLVDDQPLRVLDEATRSIAVQTHPAAQVLLTDCGIRDAVTRAWFDKTSRVSASAMPVADDLASFVKSLLDHSDGDLIIFLNVMDYISVDALQLVASAAHFNPKASLFYADHCEVNAVSTRTKAIFKPDFDPILIANHWYVEPLIAVSRDLLARVGEAAEAGCPISSLPYLLVARDYLEGRTPFHVSELACARRSTLDNSPPDAGRAQAHRRAIRQLIETRPTAEALSVEPSASGGPLRLRTAAPVEGVRQFDAGSIWTDASAGLETLRGALDEPDTQWIAILLEGDRSQILRELSAPAQFDGRVNVVCGTLVDMAGAFRWSGGVFLPGGRLFDPHQGRTIETSACPEFVASQRCIDVAAPVNVMIRVQALERVLDRFAIVDADSLMVTLGLDAVERGELICVTPHLCVVAPPGLPTACADRRGIVLGHPALERGSRWYGGQLDVERPYRMPGVE